MGALLRKEWREHRWALLMLWSMMAVTLHFLLRAADQAGSPMVAFQRLISVMTPLVAVVLVSRIVVREYMGRTQLFLETLPVSRLQVIAAKWLAGAVFLFVPLAICLAVTVFASRNQVVLTPQFVAFVALRAASFALLVYALAFALGLTGRYRYLLWAVLVVCVIVASERGQLSFAQWPPSLLVQETMVYERTVLPLRAVLMTCAAALAFVAATAVLALSAQGSLVVALSRRMTPREKSTLTIAVMATIAAVSMVDLRKEKPLFKLQQSIVSTRGPAVAVAMSGKVDGEQVLADQLSADFEKMQGFLGLPDAPAVSVLPDNALDPGVFQRAMLPEADGVVLRAAFDDAQFDRDGFRAYAIASWLQWHSRDRLAREEVRWLLDGFSQWLAARGDPDRQALLALRAAAAARLLERRGMNAGSTLRQWLSAREQLGTCLGDALAWRMVASVEQQVGSQRFQALARRAFATRPPNDLRGLLFEPSVDQLFADAALPALPVLQRQFVAALQRDQASLAATLDRIALPTVTFSARQMRGGAFEVHYQTGKAGSVVAPFSVRYRVLGPWESELANESLALVDATQSGVLPVSYGSGTRLFTAVEQRDPILGCSVRVASRRWEVQ